MKRISLSLAQCGPLAPDTLMLIIAKEHSSRNVIILKFAPLMSTTMCVCEHLYLNKKNILLKKIIYKLCEI